MRPWPRAAARPSSAPSTAQGSPEWNTPVAIKATARELACLIYLMVTEGQKYVEQGIDAYEKRRLNRKFAHLDRQAENSGSQLVPAPQNDETQTQCRQLLRQLLLKSTLC